MLNYMNGNSDVKLEISQDFVSHFLDDSDVDRWWAATRINQGFTSEASILSDMWQVYKVFIYD